MLAQLRHPSIAQILDAGVLPGGMPWFAMEYVEGLPLDQYAASTRSACARGCGCFAPSARPCCTRTSAR